MQNRIREARKAKGFSLEELAAMIGVSRTTIANYERHDTEPKLENWEKLANALGVTVPYLQATDWGTNINAPETQAVKHAGAQFVSLIGPVIDVKSTLVAILKKFEAGGWKSDTWSERQRKQFVDTWTRMYNNSSAFYDDVFSLATIINNSISSDKDPK